ncbi:hypothetical protein BDU57DRAFT_504437 [Ampelomyces quisqualis]|uniref:Uncharacterized protein n=1 Tax=Ampelomyces quisqualis TaxID=50730 RepID=A0A6A5QEY2_AMPQU|nr:hypothetical protein BDU57DRAFT_504437 [Ampelomyces quisqualis]
MAHTEDIAGTNFTLAAANYTLGEVVTHCHKSDCSWLYMSHLAGLQNPPPLLPNPELSGIGVILGFSITAYLTLILLVMHYFTVHDARRTRVVNAVDDGLLTFVRQRLISWEPSRRFEYAMEKSVLILSDTQLVTGLGILAAGYSQLQCGISAYHWQIMVFIAWFASFSFLSAMTFLEGYFQTNSSMRLIRVGFMFILSSLLIAALLPTGSKNWLNLFHEGEGYYPSLSALCFYKQISMSTFTITGGPKIWSMAFSVFVVGISYLHCGIRLFDPGASISHKYLRAWPASKIKQCLNILEEKNLRNGARARLWHVPYLTCYGMFTCCRAFYDISGSMLLEIIWLTFAIAWGTIKIWATRSAAGFNFDGKHFDENRDVSQENSWSFGQTLPLVLILLPLLSMAQAYLDNDAKAQGALEPPRERHRTVPVRKYDSGNATETSEHCTTVGEEELLGSRRSTPCSIAQCNHHSSLRIAHTRNEPAFGTRHLQLPQYPYDNFTAYPWYNDQILLLLCQILMLTGFSLYVLAELANIMGISAILRNRLFLLWVFAIIPLTSLIHLAIWYAAALMVVRWPGAEEWLTGKENCLDDCGRKWAIGRIVYWTLRMILVAGCLMFTFFASLEAASPTPLNDSL